MPRNKEYISRVEWVVKPDHETFEALDAAITSVGLIVKQCARIYQDSAVSERLAVWKCNCFLSRCIEWLLLEE